MDNKKNLKQLNKISNIQDAATKVFFTKGYRSSTIDEIAKKAGLAKGTVYLYFKNKDDLYLSLMEFSAASLVERMILFEDEIDRSSIKNGNQMIMGVLDVLYKWYKADPDGFAVTTRFQQGGLLSRMSQGTIDRLNEIGRQGFKTMSRILSKSKKKGFIKEEVDVSALAEILYASFLGVTQFEENKKHMGNKDYIFKTLKEAFSIIAEGICCHPTKEKKG